MHIRLKEDPLPDEIQGEAGGSQYGFHTFVVEMAENLGTLIFKPLFFFTQFLLWIGTANYDGDPILVGRNSN